MKSIILISYEEYSIDEETIPAQIEMMFDEEAQEVIVGEDRIEQALDKIREYLEAEDTVSI